MRFAKVVFTVAGVWGVLVLTPLYFMFDAVGRWYPPAVTHPDVYYGFVGVALVWQIAFLVISRDPRRYRPLMLVAALEKFVYVSTLGALYAGRRLAFPQFTPAVPDLTLGCLFVAAFFKTSAPQARLAAMRADEHAA